MARCWIALGGNLGPVRETFARALDRLVRLGALADPVVSTIHETAPVGVATELRFLNAACSARTEQDPRALLAALQEAEHAAGRKRPPRGDAAWPSRPLDLDLLLYDEAVIGYEPDAPDDLIVPHPRLWYRRFVLDPLCEIAGEAFHPVQKCSLSTLRERLLRRPLPIAVHACEPASADAVAAALLTEFPRQICRVTAGDGAAGAAAAVELRMVPRPAVSREPRVAELPSNSESAIPLARIIIRSALG